MSSINSNFLVLVYYNFRGKLQPIRNMLFYLDLPFVEIHWGNEQQKKNLPQEAINCLKGVKIDKAALPLLAFQGYFIYDIYPIMAYLCRRFKRQDLLGVNLQQRTRLQEILQIFFVRQPNSMSQLFKLAESCVHKQEEEIIRQKRVSVEKFFNESGYLKEICLHLQHQNRTETYVLGNMTILDFLFLESCHYMLGMFNDLDKKRSCEQNVGNGSSKMEEEYESQYERHLQTMRNYLQFMHQHPFYIKNIDYLESFSIICDNFTVQRAEGLRKIWAYNKTFVK